MNSLRTLVLALPLLSLPASALAIQQGQDLERKLERLLRRDDSNGDARVSKEEFGGKARAFKRLDRDGNGFIDQQDLPAAKTNAAPLEPMNDEASLQFFEKSIRPVLEESCFRCHSTKGEKVRGGLLLDSRELMLMGGDSGPALVPGNADASLILIALRYTDEDLEMPPKRALPDQTIQDFEHWINMGAPWTKATTDETVELGQHGIDIEAGREWWSFQPPTRPSLPEVQDSSWALGDLDRFVQAAVEQHGLHMVDDAEDRSWLRRVSLDLSGLPPTLAELEDFIGDNSEARYATVVDRLLAAPTFGERWGRHWLDVARYAESSGRDSNIVYPHAWRYRDYVIDSFDADLPFDQFLAEQIAGDLMAAEDPTERARLDVATGYLAIGSKSHSIRDPRQFAADLADEQVDALTQGVLGVTVACARCHDHKFDPIPTEDYYALAGVFRSSQTLYGTFTGNKNRYPTGLRNLPDDAEVVAGHPMDDELLDFIQEARSRLSGDLTSGKRRRGAPEDADQSTMMGKSPEDEKIDRRRARRREQAERDTLHVMDDLLSRFDRRGQPTHRNRVAMGLGEATPSDAPLLIRGDVEAVGPLVPRGVPQVLSPKSLVIPDGTSGRLQVAGWIASKDNPLTARVWANRVWLHLFGAGLVSSPNNFGMSGKLPSHPELLDWLAVTFMDEDSWSTKSLVRRIVLSRTYRLSTDSHAGNQKMDPLVVQLWRMPDRRLDAEVIRDSMLAASGTLDLSRPEGSIVNNLEGQQRRERILGVLNRASLTRSVYLPSLRNRMPASMEVFDAADPSFVTGDRSETSVATQALYLMNNEEVIQISDEFARRVMTAEPSTKKRIQLAFELALGRPPTSGEVSAVKSFLRDYSRLPQAEDNSYDRRKSKRSRSEKEQAIDATTEVWSAFVQSLFQCAEFRYAG